MDGSRLRKYALDGEFLEWEPVTLNHNEGNLDSRILS